MPGMDLHIVDDDGNDVPNGTMGNVVLGLPLSPSSFRTLYGDEERFYTSYLKRFKGRWFDTGDAGMFTDERYTVIMSRADDVINVAAHRLSTGDLAKHHFSLAESLRYVRCHRRSNCFTPCGS